MVFSVLSRSVRQRKQSESTGGYGPRPSHGRVSVAHRKLLASGDIISDISDHFSQFYITTSAKDRLQQVKKYKICD